MLSREVVFDLLESERAANGLGSHHLHSMDAFLETLLPRIVTEQRELTVEAALAVHHLELVHVQVGKPVAKAPGGFMQGLDAASARVTRHTYANPVVVDVVHRVFQRAAATTSAAWQTADVFAVNDDIAAVEAAKAAGLPVPARRGAPARERSKRRRPCLDAEQTEWVLTEERTYRQVTQFAVPCMVRSAGCRHRDAASLAPNERYDVDGQFVIKGVPKVMQTQRRLADNRFFVFPAGAGKKWTWMGEIRARHPDKVRSTSTLRVHVQVGEGGSGVLQGAVELPYVAKLLPLMAVVRVLGFRTADEAAVCAATGGALSGVAGIPAGCPWDTPAIQTTRQWVYSLLRGSDGCADRDAAVATFEALTTSAVLQWVGEQAKRPRRRAGGDRAKYAAHLFANEFLPHLGLQANTRTLSRKGRAFAGMLGWVADVARGLAPPDDRDHAANRAYDADGQLLANLARQHYRLSRRKLASEIRRFADMCRFVNVPEMLAVKRITDGLVYAMATGNWGMLKGGSTQTGVSQMLMSTNVVAAASHVRRVDTPMNRQHGNTRPRQVSASAWGHMCPAETPEGSACGLVEQLAQCTWMCQGHAADALLRRVVRVLGDGLRPLLGDATDAELLTGAVARLPVVCSSRSAAARVPRPLILDHPEEEWEALRAAVAAADARLAWETDPCACARVAVNGVTVGVVADGAHAAEVLRAARRARLLPFDVAVELHPGRGVVNVVGEPGTLRRALLVLGPDGGLGHVAAAHAAAVAAADPPEALWRALVASGAVEYLSKAEEEGTVVAASPLAAAAAVPPAATHCEVHPQCLLGVAAASIPFSHHNQAPRTAYFASMCKQAAGAVPPEPTASTGLRLWYPQVPLVTTWAAAVHGVAAMPLGTNCIVAVAAYGGRNQEDSLYMNADSAARGLFALTLSRVLSEDCAAGFGADAQQFERPPPTATGRKTGNYAKLGPRGWVPPGTHVRAGDAVIGKTVDINDVDCEKRATRRQDASLLLSSREGTLLVDEVHRVAGRDERAIVQLRAHGVRFMQVGDKLTSVHGQKGVVGALLPARDMPYGPGGLVPDLIINPHAFPSRMTMGQAIEAALGVVCAAHGELADGTPFNDGSAEGDASAAAAALDLLRAAGLHHLGDVRMTRGDTGESILAPVFAGCMQYLRVRQMVDDKHHARGAVGPTAMITGQPRDGKAHDGGYRFGDMERDCSTGHGAANTLLDRLLFASDFCTEAVCKQCGMFAAGPAPRDRRDVIMGANEVGGFCKRCGVPGTVVSVHLPQGGAVVLKEFMAFHVRPRLLLAPRTDVNPFTAAALGCKRARPEVDDALLAPAVQGSAAGPCAAGRLAALGAAELPAGVLPVEDDAGGSDGGGGNCDRDRDRDDDCDDGDQDPRPQRRARMEDAAAAAWAAATHMPPPLACLLGAAAC